MKTFTHEFDVDSSKAKKMTQKTANKGKTLRVKYKSEIKLFSNIYDVTVEVNGD